MTVLEFDYPLPNNVKARDPVGSNNSSVALIIYPALNIWPQWPHRETESVW